MATLAQDWEDKINVSSKFETDHCSKRVLNALKDNDVAWNLLQAFTSEVPENINLTFDLNNSLPSNQGGRTIKTGGDIGIEMNSNLFTDQPFISIAQYMLHEIIHAQLFAKSELDMVEFDELFKEFADSQVGSQHHNIIVNNYISLMGMVLSELDDNALDITLYEALAYRGLERTDYYENEIRDTELEVIIQGLQVSLLSSRPSCKR